MVSQAGARLDLIMLPKINTAADVYAADLIVSQIEMARRAQFDIGFEILIETASGLQHVEIALQCSGTRCGQRTMPRDESRPGIGQGEHAFAGGDRALQ